MRCAMASASAATRIRLLPVIEPFAGAGSRLNPGRRALAGISLLGTVAAIAVTFAVATSPILAHPVGTGVLRGLVVASAVTVGCYLAYRRPESWFGLLLAATGFLFGLTALNASANPAVFTIGQVVNPVLWLTLAYLFLAFPRDTISHAGSRRLIFGLGLATAVGWLATTALSDQLPASGHFVSCVAGCPENGLQITTVASTLADVIRIVASTFGVALAAVTTVLLVRRIRRGGALERRVLVAPLAVMTFVAISAAAGAVLHETGASAALEYRVSSVGRAAAPVLPLGFLVGLVMGRVFVTETTTRLISQLSTGHHSPAETRSILARVLEQPSLQLAFWRPEHHEYIDTDGAAIPRSLDVPGRAVTAIEVGGQPYAVVVHESALREERTVLELVGSSSMLAFENMRLRAELIASLGDLRASRARIVAVADSERRRVERDLHDGAQQQLIALRVKLRLLEEADEADPATRAELVHELENDADAALEDLRSLVRGIYPPLLVDRGLRDALSWALRSGSIGTSLYADGLRRYPADVEAAVYFCCLEAIQNATKHAAGATRIVVQVHEVGEDLVFGVRDNGAGFDPDDAMTSTGLINMRDRVGAAGGTLQITSTPGIGTSVRGAVPTTSVVKRA